MQIVNPQFSFVQFSPGNSASDCDYMLPLALNGDLKFQVIISTSGNSESMAVAGRNQKLYVVKSGAVITDDASLTANTLLTQPFFFMPTQITDTQVLLCWPFGINDLTTLADKTCFRLCARIDNGSTILYFISNCFQKISDTKYYNTLEYYCNSDNYGFTYCDGCANKIRLPFYIGGVQLKEEQGVYIFSDGTRKLTKYQAGRLYEVKIGTVPEDIHNKIATALAHDYVNIESPRYSGGIRKDGDYTIAWDRPEDLDAPASTKAYATPYFVVNNNCAECSDFVPCVGVHIPDFVFDHAVEGVAYSKSITVTGDSPVTFTGFVTPSWMGRSVSGKTITFSGTPGAEDVGTGFIVSFTVTNPCGTDSKSKTIDVTETVCDPVAISGTPVLPDAQVGVLYNYEISLTGDTPFEIDFEGPTWMHAYPDYDNKKIKLSGTPSEAGTGIAVSLEISNCDGANTVPFSDTIDVILGEAHLNTEDYDGIGGAVTDVCTCSIEFTRTANAQSDAAAAGQRVQATYHVEIDNGCEIDVDVIFETTDTSVIKIVDGTCGNPSNYCAAVNEHGITCTNVIVI